MFKGEVHGRLQVDWEYPDNEPTPIYTLIGGPIVYVPMRAVDGDAPAGSFRVGAFCFYPLGRDFSRDAVIAAHITGPLWWLAVLRYYAQTIPERILATAYVWGLAEYPFNEKQTWRSVHVLRWAENTIKRTLKHHA